MILAPNIVFPLKSAQLLLDHGCSIEPFFCSEPECLGIYFSNNTKEFRVQHNIHSTDIFIKYKDVETVLGFLHTTQLTTILIGLGYLDEEGNKHAT